MTIITRRAYTPRRSQKPQARHVFPIFTGKKPYLAQKTAAITLCMAPALGIMLVLTGLTAPAAQGCLHTHGEACGYAAGADCTHACGEDCAESCVHAGHDTDCGYEESAPCRHVHDEGCGGLLPEQPGTDAGAEAGAGISAHGIIIASFEGLDASTLWQGYDMGEIRSQEELALPGTLNGADTEGHPAVITGVLWQSIPAFDPEASAFYEFSPILPEGFSLAEGETLPVISVFIRPAGGLVVMPLSTGTELANAITDYNLASKGSGGLTASWNATSQALTINGSITGAVTGLTLNIDPGVAVDWQATLSGSSNAYILTFKGSGMNTVNINGGLIENKGAGGAVSVSGVEISVNNGASVSSPSTGIAIFNDSTTAAIHINGGTVAAGNSSAIQSNGAGSAVTVAGGSVTNAATSNINPTINMTAGNAVNVTLSGGLVQTANPSNTSYVIQTTGDILVYGQAQIRALAGRAINLVGMDSTATIQDNAIVSAVSGIAVSTATTNTNTVANAKIIVEGGWVYTESGTAAIQTTGTNGDVIVKGGQVTATTGLAVKASHNAEISGGFVFAYGTSISQVVSAPHAGYPTGGGIVAAWNKAILNPTYVEATFNDLTVLPANPASPPNDVYWHKEGAKNGVKYGAGEEAFFELPVSVESFATEAQGLIFNIGERSFYLGGSPYHGQPGNWGWDDDTKTLTLNGFSWVTSSPVALTIMNGTDIHIRLIGINTFVSAGAGANAAGIGSTADMTIQGSGTLNASASAGMGVNCAPRAFTMESGTVNAAAGNGTNTHGMNAGALTIIGGMLNASSGGPATTGAYFGINATSLTIREGDGTVTASGNSRAASNISGGALSLPPAYTYIKSTRPDGGNAAAFNVFPAIQDVPGSAGSDPANDYKYSANNCYVQIQARKPRLLSVINGTNGANGTGSGSFYAGQAVPVISGIHPPDAPGTPPTPPLTLGPIASPTMKAPPYMYPLNFDVFASWASGDGGSFADATVQATAFTMPDHNATVTATAQKAYKLWASGAHIYNELNPSSQTFQLGYYLEGAEILLKSNITSYSDGDVFMGWKETNAPNGSYIPGGGMFLNPQSTSTLYIMPTANTYIQAPWGHINSSSLDYTLRIVGGTGITSTGISQTTEMNNLMAGTWVTLNAGPPSEGMEFAYWEWEFLDPPPPPVPPATGPYPGAMVNSSAAADAKFVMGEGDITVTAVYRDKQYALTVHNGTGGGLYKAGEAVLIEADPPPARGEFTGWATGDGGVFANPALMQTTYTMPANNASVTAAYEDVEFELIVEHGSGSGFYKAGEQAAIAAVPVPGEAFLRWEKASGGAGGVFGDANTAGTTFTMPGYATTIIALFTQAAPPQINYQIAGTDTIILTQGYAAFSKSYAVTGISAPAVSVTGAAGMAITPAGLLTIPAGLAVGSHTAVITAQNSEDIAVMTVTIIVEADNNNDGGQQPDPPVNTAPRINGQTAGTDTVILTQGYAAFSRSFAVTGYPSPSVNVLGVTGAAVTDAGLLAIPAALAGGAYTATVTAQNIAGTATMTVTIIVRAAPQINGQTAGADTISLAQGYADFTKSYTITGYPVPTASIAGIPGARVTDAGLLAIPAGLAAGRYGAIITAQNTEGLATMAVTLHVQTSGGIAEDQAPEDALPGNDASAPQTGGQSGDPGDAGDPGTHDLAQGRTPTNNGAYRGLPKTGDSSHPLRLWLWLALPFFVFCLIIVLRVSGTMKTIPASFTRPKA